MANYRVDPGYKQHDGLGDTNRVYIIIDQNIRIILIQSTPIAWYR